MFWKPLLFSLALLSLTSSTLAQTPDDESTLNAQEKQEKAIEMKKELERKTLLMLDEVIASAQTLKLPENRALVLSSAADLIWARDEKRARSLFKEALNNLSALGVSFNEKMSDEQRREFALFTQQRKEILLLAARHDADLALELLRSSRLVLPNNQPGAASVINNEDQQLEQSLAIQVVNNDPKRAFQMAEDNLSKGFSFELLNFLNRLSDKDTELAARFADDIINKLRSENLETNPQAAFVATMLLRTSMMQGGSAFLGDGSGPISKTPFKLSERQLHDLLEMVTSPSLTNGASLQYLLPLSFVMPEIKKQYPERAQILYSRIREATSRLAPEQRMYFENQELIQTGSVEALLEAAAKSSEKMRDMLYEQAAWKAIQSGDTDRARQIVNDNVKDSATRDRLFESFESYSLWNSIEKEKMDEAREKIARLKSKELRASILTQLAMSAALKKDRKLALQFLSDALPLVNLKPRNDNQLNTLLQVIRVYAIVEPAKAFEMIESLVDQANELLAAASMLNGFLTPAGTFRKGELVLQPGYFTVSQRFGDLGKQLGALAFLNFERTKAAADKFQRNETRIMARLFIVQSVLSEQLGASVVAYDGFVMARE
ncbi:MAG TPA: hypothetical protein VF779_09895 [Pyrinomonadaceae bacterium]